MMQPKFHKRSQKKSFKGKWILLSLIIVLFFLVPLAWKNKAAASVALLNNLGSRTSSCLAIDEKHKTDALSQWNQQQEQEQSQALDKLHLINDSIKEKFSSLSSSLSTYLGSAIQAQVILKPSFRATTTLWLRAAKPVIIGSAVVEGNHLIGVVDYVSKNSARVRLITDPAFSVSVRALRFDPMLNGLEQEVHLWLEMIASCSNLEDEQSQQLKNTLNQTLAILRAHSKGNFLAKGILRGGSDLWKKKYPILEGEGFNYAWPDSYNNSLDASIPLVKKGDILVTSGLDGLFPAGLRVACVISLQAQDPAFSIYKLKALPLIASIDSLQYVWVLPPLTEMSLKLNQDT
jgi:cell shape-determining protein MreC